jgi:hypothetical protein
MDAKEWAELEDTNRKTVAQIVGGVALVAGLYFTWMNVLISQDVQITNRFSRAVEFLGARDQRGNIELEVRLGAIYALERIAIDSERDYWTIMELLCAYVRNHASREGTDYRITPKPDVQTVLTVVGRLGKRAVDFPNPQSKRIDLSGARLRGFDLSGAHLEAANLEGADLEKANLSGAHLAKARLRNATLTSAVLRDADLKGADLTGATLTGAILINAKLQGTVLLAAKLRNASLMEAVLSQAHLVAADLEGANLRRAVVTKAEFKGADLWDAKLEEIRGFTATQRESVARLPN